MSLIVAADTRPWLPHHAFDLASAERHGVPTADASGACAGTIHLIGDPGDVVLVAKCDGCSYETGIRRADVTLAERRVKPGQLALAQSLTALGRANEVRHAMSVTKRDITTAATAAESARLAAATLRDRHSDARRMPLTDFLLSVRKIGHVRARRLTATIGASPSLRLDALTDRQRDVLIQFFGDRARDAR